METIIQESAVKVRRSRAPKPAFFFVRTQGSTTGLWSQHEAITPEAAAIAYAEHLAKSGMLASMHIALDVFNPVEGVTTGFVVRVATVTTYTGTVLTFDEVAAMDVDVESEILDDEIRRSEAAASLEGWPSDWKPMQDGRVVAPEDHEA